MIAIDNENKKIRSGRPNKQGLDYFSHYVTHTDEETILINTFGCSGYAVYYFLLEKITSNGYYYELSKSKKRLLISNLQITEDEFNDILSNALDLELFNKKLFDDYNILTSEKTQLSYIFSASRRKVINFIGEYYLISDDKFYQEFDDKIKEKLHIESIYVNNNSIFVDNNSISADENQQSKSNSIEKEKEKQKSKSEVEGKGYKRESAERGNKEEPTTAPTMDDNSFRARFYNHQF